MSVLSVLKSISELPEEAVKFVEKEVNAVEGLIKKDAPELKALLMNIITLYNEAKAAAAPVASTIQALQAIIAELASLTL